MNGYDALHREGFMPFSISVANEKNNLVWEKQFPSKGELEKLHKKFEGRDSCCLLCSTLMPVRTNNCKNWAEDFFFPTLVNHANKVKSVVGKIFAVLGALVLDLLTFPIRLLTCIPRVISNAAKGVHPLRKYLLDQKVDKKLLASDYVTVRWQYENEEKVETIHFIEHPCEEDDVDC